MRLGVQPLPKVRNAPVRISNALNDAQFRFLSSTTGLSDTKKEPEEDSTKSNPSNKQSPASDPDSNKSQPQSQSQPTKAKSVAQADEELREKLEQMSGEGGAAGIEYEDGKPNTMKRGVRNNMFRYI